MATTTSTRAASSSSRFSRRCFVRDFSSSSFKINMQVQEYGPRYYFICNPFTRQFDVKTKGLNGFGYESSTKTYKVIHIPDSCVSCSFNLQIFSSDTSEWSTREGSCSHEMHINNYIDPKSCYSRFRSTSHLHIVNYHNGIWCWTDGRGDRMIAYNHNNGGGSGGECRLYDLPERSTRVNFEQQCVGVSKGLLCYGQIEKVGEISTISVWVFQDGYYSNGSTWGLVCKDIKIEDREYVIPRLRKKKEYSFIAFNPVDPNVVIMECRHDNYYEYEVAYNIKTRKCEMLRSSHLRPEC